MMMNEDRFHGIEILRNVFSELSNYLKEGREVAYSKDTDECEVIGITSLLSCPLKWKYRKEYPEIEFENLEILEGFSFEKELKDVFRIKYGDRFKDEVLVEYKSKNYPIKIEGHIDIQIKDEENKLIVNYELKAPRITYIICDSSKLSYKKFMETDVLIDYDNNCTLVSDKYILQAKIQKLLTELNYPEYKVEQYILIKSLAQYDSYKKKMIIIYPIKESITVEDLEKLIEKFHTDKKPRFKNECNYCPYYNVVCEGVNYEDNTEEVSYNEIDVKQLKELISKYYKLKEKLKMLEHQIKFRIERLPEKKIKYGNKEIGFVEYESISLDVKKIIEKAIENNMIKELCDKNCLIVNWRHKKDLIDKFGEDIIKERKKEVKFNI